MAAGEKSVVSFGERSSGHIGTEWWRDHAAMMMMVKTQLFPAHTREPRGVIAS